MCSRTAAQSVIAGSQYLFDCAVPVVDTTPEEPPPYVIVVHGPPGVGKTTLIKNLLKHYTNQNIGDIKGPITVVSGKTRRLTFVECPQVLRPHILCVNCISHSFKV